MNQLYSGYIKSLFSTEQLHLEFPIPSPSSGVSKCILGKWENHQVKLGHQIIAATSQIILRPGISSKVFWEVDLKISVYF
jgi:hypothetical protein